jgi:hypothetical protein
MDLGAIISPHSGTDEDGTVAMPLPRTVARRMGKEAGCDPDAALLAHRSNAGRLM